jgi:hypothetical protein
MIEDFKYLSEGKALPVPTLSLSPLFLRTSKRLSMGGGDRYNAILEFKRTTWFSSLFHLILYFKISEIYLIFGSMLILVG